MKYNINLWFFIFLFVCIVCFFLYFEVCIFEINVFFINVVYFYFLFFVFIFLIGIFFVGIKGFFKVDNWILM
ncbi:hypothetical protein Q6314_26755, partial [Klebsiella pneumoniae]